MATKLCSLKNQSSIPPCNVQCDVLDRKELLFVGAIGGLNRPISMGFYTAESLLDAKSGTPSVPHSGFILLSDVSMS